MHKLPLVARDAICTNLTLVAPIVIGKVRIIIVLGIKCGDDFNIDGGVMLNMLTKLAWQNVY